MCSKVNSSSGKTIKNSYKNSKKLVYVVSCYKSYIKNLKIN